jgi:hypothetical protein
MRLFTTCYHSDEQLNEWIVPLVAQTASSTLVQIFCGSDNSQALQAIARIIRTALPDATIVGASSAGEILDGRMLEESIVICLALFEQTTLTSMHSVNSNSWTLGQEVARSLVVPQTRCVIMFADGLRCNGDELLKGFQSLAGTGLVLAGGMAGDNYRFKRTFVLHGDEIIEGGAVAVALAGEGLHVFNAYNLSWRPIGKKMTVTRSNGNLIHEIDHRPIIEIYRDYLGPDVVASLPESAIEFPLLFQQGTTTVARSMLAVNNDGTIQFAGNLPEGTMVRFGVASSLLFECARYDLHTQILAAPIEGLFIYSCSARKKLMGNELVQEFRILSDITPLAGFLTYGELYADTTGYELLNITTTVLGNN